MTPEEKVRGLIRSIGGQGTRTESVLLAEVIEVDKDNATMRVKFGSDLEIADVRLRSIIDGDQGMWIYPRKGSIVVLMRLGVEDEFMAIGYEKYDKVLIKGEQISLEVNQENIIFNGNRLDSYLTDINALTDKINQLEQQINDLKGVFRNWTPVIQDGGAKLKIGVSEWAAVDIIKTQIDDIKDEKILN